MATSVATSNKTWLVTSLIGVSAIVGRRQLVRGWRIGEFKDEEPVEKKSEVEFRSVKMLVMRPHVCVERWNVVKEYSEHLEASQLMDTRGPTSKNIKRRRRRKKDTTFRMEELE